VFDGLKSRLMKALALRALRQKFTQMRQGGSAVTKLLDGNKSWLTGIVYVGALLYALVSGHDIMPLVNAGLDAMGIGAPGMREAAIIAICAHSALAVWGAVSGTIKRVKQWKAGATLTEVGSAEGVIKGEVAAIAEEIRKLGARDEILSAGITARSLLEIEEAKATAPGQGNG